MCLVWSVRWDNSAWRWCRPLWVYCYNWCMVLYVVFLMLLRVLDQGIDCWWFQYIIHTQEQYRFIHDAILESIVCGKTQVNSGELRSMIEIMKTIDPATEKTQFQTQFKVRMMLISSTKNHTLFNYYIAMNFHHTYIILYRCCSRSLLI